MLLQLLNPLVFVRVGLLSNFESLLKFLKAYSFFVKLLALRAGLAPNFIKTLLQALELGSFALHSDLELEVSLL